jgi:hypothetical protein|tara:strand:- start:240 stop:533 length:294 start_codon:yes stop_codon:yes gene_type:complete
MNHYVFEITDKTGRKIHLSKERWKHIREYHPNIENPDEISESIQKPDKIIVDEREDVNNFYKYFKHKKQKSKFLKVVVKYLNDSGFIMSAHFTRNIK